MDSVIDFSGHDKLAQLSSAKVTDISQLVDFNEFIKYSDEYQGKKQFTCGPFKDSDEYNLVGPKGTEYKFNQYGFRGEWDLSTSRKVRIGVFGDSCTFGIGVDEKDTYVNLLKEMYPGYSILNFGMPGGSIDNIAKLYSAAQRLIGFDYVLMLLPDFSRFCWPQYEKEWQHKNMILGPGLDPSNEDHMAYIRNYWDELEVHRCISYLNWIKDNSNDVRVLSLWSWSKHTNKIIKQCLPEENFARITNKDVEIDHARDHQHPGPKTHKRIAELWFEQLELR